MKIVLTSAANMANGGYSWVLGDGHTQEDVTGLILDVLEHNDGTSTRELDDFFLAPGDVAVSRESLAAAGFSGFAITSFYIFKPREFTIMEEAV